MNETDNDKDNVNENDKWLWHSHSHSDFDFNFDFTFIFIFFFIAMIINTIHIIIMETTFMNTENSKINESHRFKLDLADKINLKNC